MGEVWVVGCSVSVGVGVGVGVGLGLGVVTSLLLGQKKEAGGWGVVV